MDLSQILLSFQQYWLSRHLNDFIGKQYGIKRILTAQFVQQNENKNIRGVALVNKTESQGSLCTGCNSKKSTFLEDNSGLKTPVIKIYW